MNVASDKGIALVVALIALVVMTAWGATLVLTTTSDTLIAASFRDGRELFYAADAALARVVVELSHVADWNGVLDGSVRSALVDGPSTVRRTLPDGSAVDLDQVASRASCGKPVCAMADLTRTTAARPWGTNNPVWRLYAHGRPIDMLATGTLDSPEYVVVLVADDPSENDGNPMRDGATAANPGSGIIGLRAEAFGPRRAYRVIEMTIWRAAEPEATGSAAPRVLSWRERR